MTDDLKGKILVVICAMFAVACIIRGMDQFGKSSIWGFFLMVVGLLIVYWASQFMR